MSHDGCPSYLITFHSGSWPKLLPNFGGHDWSGKKSSRNFICMEGLSHHLCIWCVSFLSIEGVHPLKIALDKSPYSLFSSKLIHPTAPAPVAVAFGAMILPFFKSRWKSTKSDPIKEVVAARGHCKTCVRCSNRPVIVGNTPVFKYLDEPKESLHIDKLQSSKWLFSSTHFEIARFQEFHTKYNKLSGFSCYVYYIYIPSNIFQQFSGRELIWVVTDFRFPPCWTAGPKQLGSM